jgi:hypothetical protein
MLSILYYSNVVQRLTDFDLRYTVEYRNAGIFVLVGGFTKQCKTAPSQGVYFRYTLNFIQPVY